jgi:hypothetical protein
MIFVKKNVERIKMDGAVLNEDFVVVSKVAMTDDFSFYTYEEGMDLSKVVSVSETLYPEELVEFVYDVGPNVDIRLAVTLGLGVVKSLSDGKVLLYHADNVDDEDRMQNEMLRLGMYYQIMNPDYDDRRLNYVFETNGGEFYLRMLLFCDTDEPIQRLREIFTAKKGRGNNIVQFKVPHR